MLQEGVSRHPTHAQFVMLHARLLAEQGHTGEALTALEQAIGNTEPQAELFALAAALYQQQRNYEQSVRVYQRALQMQPQQGHWWMGLGISLEGAGKPAEAKVPTKRRCSAARSPRSLSSTYSSVCKNFSNRPLC